MILRRNPVVALSSLWLGLFVAAPAFAASMQQVDQNVWWEGISGFPSYVNMYIYVPDQLATNPPIVVVPHHCQGTAQSSYNEMSSLRTYADQNGFVMIFPEATGQNCWDAGSDRSLNHDGKGDAPAIVQMVKYALSEYDGDASRVYSVGSSSGGIMTEALLGVFPDVFMAGVSLMGVPCGCWASEYNDITGNGGTAQWSGPCAGGNVTMTGQEWGDLVRSYFPGYTGHRPRLQHWHGTADTTLNYKNLAEDIKEWTNLLGLSETPDGSDSPTNGTTRQYWTNDCGYTVYETFSVDGVGHALSGDGAAIAAYFGLDQAGGVDPEVEECGAGGGTGMGGATGGGGESSVGGSTSGGSTSGGTTSGGVSNNGGRPAQGGNSNPGGATSGGSATTGGQATSGGQSSAGGSLGTGGSATSGGALIASGGTTGNGGSTSPASGGSNLNPIGGSGVIAGNAGSDVSGGGSADRSDSGCSCNVRGKPSSNAWLALLMGSVLLLRRRRTERTRAG